MIELEHHRNAIARITAIAIVFSYTTLAVCYFAFGT